jgi:EAL domain-containing protein (putative c-di-GMP-specific phosphodiesterase class I)
MHPTMAGSSTFASYAALARSLVGDLAGICLLDPAASCATESEAIGREVRRLKVGYAQGFAYGEPEPLADVLESLAADESRQLHKLYLET